MNPNIFQTGRETKAPTADTKNLAGGAAFSFSPEHELAQYMMTGIFADTYYEKGSDAFARVLSLCQKCDPEFLARAAVYGRKQGFMKDVPAFLVAALTVIEGKLAERVFRQVIDNAKMVRNFVQVIQSGAAGRKSLGRRPKRLVADWLLRQNGKYLLTASIGNKPTLADIIKLSHPKAKDKALDAAFAYFLGKLTPEKAEHLPAEIKAFEDFKQRRLKGLEAEVPPGLDFRLVSSLNLSPANWAQIARDARFIMTMKNLQTFARHDVFKNAEVTKIIAERLASAEIVQKARVMPYQLLMAYSMVTKSMPRGRYGWGAVPQPAFEVPMKVENALQDALEHSLVNIPDFETDIVVGVDVSGSMQSPVTGHRRGATTRVRCVDVAALFGSALMRKNPDRTIILPFEGHLVAVKLNPRDTVMTNAKKLADIGGGSTRCGAVIEGVIDLAKKGVMKPNLVVFVSDNESWVGKSRYGHSTRTMELWEKYKGMNKKAKMVCIDIQISGTTQALDRKDILNVGGFNDGIFRVIHEFVKGVESETPAADSEHWVREIKATEI